MRNIEYDPVTTTKSDKLMRKIFNQKENRFEYEIDVLLSFKREDAAKQFLSALDVDTLERLLATQIEAENYETAKLIQKQLDLKKQ